MAVSRACFGCFSQLFPAAPQMPPGTPPGRSRAAPRSAEPSEPQPVMLSLRPGLTLRALRSAAPVGTDGQSAASCAGDATGYCPWWGGLLLASWLAHEPRELLQGRRVIELGCGSTALPSVVASKRGSAVVRATDRSQANVRAARAVLACNGAVSEECDARPLAFEDTLALKGLGSWDVVLFADVLYQSGTAAPLSQAVAQLLRPGGTVVGTVGVHRTGSWEIFAEMRRQGFRVSELEVSEPVCASALQSAECLRRANRCDAAGSMGLDPARCNSNECKMLRWVRTGQTEPDTSEALCQEILHAPPSQIQFGGQGAGDEWTPTE